MITVDMQVQMAKQFLEDHCGHLSVDKREKAEDDLYEMFWRIHKWGYRAGHSDTCEEAHGNQQDTIYCAKNRKDAA